MATTPLVELEPTSLPAGEALFEAPRPAPEPPSSCGVVANSAWLSPEDLQDAPPSPREPIRSNFRVLAMISRILRGSLDDPSQ